jgi:hypothetical protein
MQTAQGATALHLLLASFADPECATLQRRRVPWRWLCECIGALLEHGARDDVLTADGDCAARLLAELVSRPGWDAPGPAGDPAQLKRHELPLGGLYSSVRAWAEARDWSLPLDAAEAALEVVARDTGLTPPLRRLILDYLVAGRSQLTFMRFLPAASAATATASGEASSDGDSKTAAGKPAAAETKADGTDSVAVAAASTAVAAAEAASRLAFRRDAAAAAGLPEIPGWRDPLCHDHLRVQREREREELN